jgi:hypothetical protein
LNFYDLTTKTFPNKIANFFFYEFNCHLNDRKNTSMFRSFTSATRLGAPARTPSKITRQIVAKDALDIQNKLKYEVSAASEKSRKSQESTVHDPSIIIGGVVGGIDISTMTTQLATKETLDTQRNSTTNYIPGWKVLKAFQQPTVEDPSLIRDGSVGPLLLFSEHRNSRNQQRSLTMSIKILC